MKTMKTVSAKVLSLMLVLSVIVGMLSVCSFSASAATVIPTPVVRQNLAKWKNYTYGDSQGTLYRTGCGIFATVNAVGYLTGNEMSVTEVAAWAHAIGGYNPGNTHAGTYRTTLYPKLEAKYGKRYGFTVDCGSGNTGYWASSSSSTLKNHLANGGTAIAHVPGHFIALVGWNGSQYHVYDSYPTSARPTGNGDCWKTPSQMATGKLKVDWFVLLTRTGTVINNQAQATGYSVTFDSRGGSAVAKQTVNEGGLAKDPGAPTRDGYEFMGWYDENGWLFTFDTTAIWADRQLHAEWKAVQWPQAVDYMPTATNTVSEEIEGQDDWIYPYFNPYSGAATLYKGGEDYYWPTALVTYQTSTDLSKTGYLNVSITSTAKFNASVVFRDANNETQKALLSQMVNGTDADFEPGTYTINANAGYYLYNNFSMPADGIVNIEAIRYYVVGEKDSYVSLNAVYFTGEQDNLNTMNPDTIAQVPAAGASGSYTYENGVLSIQGTGGYAVSFEPNVSFSPEKRPFWNVSAESDTDFDIYMTVTTSEGDRRVSLRDDYFPQFGFETYPDNGLPCGQFTKSFNILGMYTWNNVMPADGQSVIKSVTIELRGNGGAKLIANQVSDSPITHNFVDTVTKSGTWNGSIDITNDNYTLNEESEVILGKQTGITANDAKNGMNNAEHITIYDGNTVATNSTAKTGMTIRVENNGTFVSEYTLAIFGDVDCNGGVSTSDVREMLIHIVNDATMLGAAQQVAADYDANGEVSTEDARSILMEVLANA